MLSKKLIIREQKREMSSINWYLLNISTSFFIEILIKLLSEIAIERLIFFALSIARFFHTDLDLHLSYICRKLIEILR